MLEYTVERIKGKKSKAQIIAGPFNTKEKALAAMIDAERSGKRDLYVCEQKASPTSAAWHGTYQVLSITTIDARGSPTTTSCETRGLDLGPALEIVQEHVRRGLTKGQTFYRPVIAAFIFHNGTEQLHAYGVVKGRIEKIAT